MCRIELKRTLSVKGFNMYRSKTVLSFQYRQPGHNFGVTAIAMSKEGDVIMVDRQQSVLSVINESRRLYCTYDCESLPWDTTSIGNDVIAISIPGEKVITILQIKENDTKVASESNEDKKRVTCQNFRIEKVRDIVCQDECFGIDFSKGRLYSTFNAWMENPYIGYFKLDDILKENSNLQSSANSGNTRIMKGPRLCDVDNSTPELFLLSVCPLIAPYHIVYNDINKRIYVSDSGGHIVVCFDIIKGEVLGEYTFKHHACPTGITIYRESNVYVCCRDTETVHKLSPDGMSGDVILTRRDGIEKPRAICFDRITNTLLIASKTISKIREYPI